MAYRQLLLGVFALSGMLWTARSEAQENPCGKFAFSSGLDCRIEVEADCRASCTPLSFEAYCSGGCTSEVTTTCTGSCEEICVEQCDPAHLDCIAGCHTECEQPCIDQCQKDHPDEDCVSVCKGSCGMHCESACGVTPSDCLSHCRECCHGACETQVNLDCDIGCFAKVEGGCEAHCDAPTGALFCNGQYVYASDVDACIAYLVEQGLDVNVEARGNVDLGCGPDGCDIKADGAAAAAGCSVGGTPGTAGGAAAGAIGLLALGAALIRRRRVA